MKNNSLRKAQDSLFNISSQTVEQEKTFQKVRSSVALFGLAISIGSAGILLNQSENQSVDAAPLPKLDPSSQASVESSLNPSLSDRLSSSDRLNDYVVEPGAIAESTKNSVIFDLQNLKFKTDDQIDTQTQIAKGQAAQDQESKPEKLVPTDVLESSTNASPDLEYSPKNSDNSAKFSDKPKLSDKLSDRQLLDQIVSQLKSGKSIESVAEQYRHVTKIVPEAIAVEGELNQSSEGKIVPISYRRNRQDRLARQIAKQPKLKTYRIAKGDTLEAISNRTGVSQRKLAKLNRIKNPNLLVAGASIKIPVARSSYQSNYVARKSTKAPKQIATRLIQKFDNRGLKVAAAFPLVQVVSAANLPQASERSLSELERPFPDSNFEPNNAKKPQSSNNQTTSVEKRQPIEKVAKLIPNSLIFAPISVESPAPSISTAEVAIPASKPISQPIAKSSSVETLPAQNLISEPALKESQAKDFPSKPNADLSKIALLPKPIDSLAIEQSQLEGKPMELPAIPEAEASISAAEIQSQVELQARKEAEVNTQINAAQLEPQFAAEQSKPTKVAVANTNTQSSYSIEIERSDRAARELSPEFDSESSKLELKRAKPNKAELKNPDSKVNLLPAKVAALNPQPAQVLQIDRNNNLVRETQVSPKLPKLSAAAYLPQMANPSSGKISESNFIWPAAGVLSSGFGWRWGRTHQGIDIAGPVGTPIVAAGDGVIDFAGWNNGGYGYMVDIRHPDGTVTRYAHNSALYVRAGQSVNQGQAIAAMGSTGFSTGPHLHFEIRPNGGRAVNPIAYLARR